MLTSGNADRLYLIGVQEQPASTESTQITFLTTRGELRARARIRKGMKQAVILFGGSLQETGCEPIYEALDRDLATRDIGAVLLECRCPGDCAQCAIDALLVCQYLDDEGVRDIALVGWSFGASVAAAAGSVARNVRAVAAISAREATESCCRRLRSKPLLLLHGEKDRITPVDQIKRMVSKCDGPRRLIVYPGASHDLHEARNRVIQDLIDWLACVFEPSPASNPVHQSVA